MANTYATLTSLFTNIANAIRAKTGNTSSIVADSFPDAIMAIPTGSSVTVGEVTQSTTNPSIIIPDAIGKDNVSIMLLKSGSYQASAMADAGLGGVIVNGNSYYYTIMYTSEMYADSNDGFIKYNKSTGTISINNNMRYNETFIAGKYIYVTW